MEFRRGMPVPWRYFFDGRPLVVVMLFFVHSYVLYRCTMQGYSQLSGSSSDENIVHPLSSDGNTVTISPTYTLRMHFLPQHQVAKGAEKNNQIELSVAPTDALIINFPEGTEGSETEVMEQLIGTGRWQWVVPMRPFDGYDSTRSYRLKARRFPVAAGDDSNELAPPTIVHVPNISSIIEAGMRVSNRSQGGLHRSRGGVVCFVVGADPSVVRVPEGKKLLEQLFSEVGRSTISTATLGLRQLHDANWALFISPCRTNKLFAWKERLPSSSVSSGSLWWLCAAADVLLEINTAAEWVTAHFD